MINYFEGKYTINPDVILRRSFLKCSIYNIATDTSTKISFGIYSILNIYLHNATNLSEISDYFQKKDIELDYSDIQELLNTRRDLFNLLIPTETPYVVPNPYLDFSTNTHYEHTPENIDLLITNQCNLYCPHCYRNSTSKENIENINVDRMYSLIDEMVDLRVRSLKITGGEAFLVPELFDIVSYASNKRIHITILTNGTIPLQGELLKVLSSSNITLGISLDGATSHTNDKIRGVGSFEKTCSNISLLQNIGSKYNITFTVNSHNYTEVNQIVDLAKKN